MGKSKNNAPEFIPIALPRACSGRLRTGHGLVLLLAERPKGVRWERFELRAYGRLVELGLVYKDGDHLRATPAGAALAERVRALGYSAGVVVDRGEATRTVYGLLLNGKPTGVIRG